MYRGDEPDRSTLLGKNSPDDVPSNDLAGAEHVRGFGMRLWHFLSDVMSVRLVSRLDASGLVVGDKRIARPPSFKTCPPNYYLRGLEYFYKGEGGGKKILGIRSLRCRIHKEAFERMKASFGGGTTSHLGFTIQKDLEVPLAFDQGDPPFFYEEDGTKFRYPLDQNIGNPRAAAPTGTEMCGPRSAALGLIIRRDGDYSINHLSLVCAPAPRGGVQ